jgi:hypothetical protein
MPSTAPTLFHTVSRWLGRAAIACLLCSSFAALATPVAVRHSVVRDGYDYPLKVLDLALRKSGVDYVLQPIGKVTLQSRVLKMVANGADLDVAWTMTSGQREEDLLPIRIPIDKGLLGWRVFLIREKDSARFAAVRKPTDLQQFEAGQGHDWPDTEILRNNGFRVQGYPVFDSLFDMLQAGRFDYFPRSVMEVWDEQKAHAGKGLVVEQTLVLHYPTAYYFFVNKKNTALASTIETGLKRAIKDGSFDQLFNQEFGESIQRTRMASRRKLELTNPLLPRETPLGQKELWLQF